MERKYKIDGASIVMPVTIDFICSKHQTNYQVQTHVDLMNDRVFFLGDKIEGIDYDDLEQEILLKVRPNLYESPRMPEGIEEKMKKATEPKNRGFV